MAGICAFTKLICAAKGMSALAAGPPMRQIKSHARSAHIALRLIEVIHGHSLF
jgi:hypothetical protein